MAGDDRTYPRRPIPGVGVVAFRGDQFLLIQRGKEPRKGEWSIPGGAVELGETWREAARREFREECGGEVELTDLADAVDIIVRDEAGRAQFHYAIVDFWGEWQSGEPAPGGDVAGVRWVSAHELDSYALPDYTRSVIERAIRARAARRG